MDIIVVGCGRVGAELCYRLFKKGHRVTVIDNHEESFGNLPHDFRGRMLEGEALNQDVLLRAGIDTAQGLAAVTSSDTLNVVVAYLASSYYKIQNVVARNYDSRFRPLHETFNLQVVSSSSWGAQRIEELLHHQEMRTVFSAGNGEVEVYEFTVPPAWEGRRLGELLPENSCTPTALTRAGRATMPDADTLLESGDAVLVSATFDGIEMLRKNLKQAVEV